MPQKYSKSLYRKMEHFRNVTLLKKDMEIKPVKTSNQMVRNHQDGAPDPSLQVKHRMSHDSLETSSEEESDDIDYNLMDPAVGKTSLSIEQCFAIDRDEADSMCFARHLNILPRSRQISLSESEDSFIVFGQGDDDKDCGFFEDSSDPEDEDQELEDLNEDVLRAEIMRVEIVGNKPAGSKSNISVKSEKKVRFANDGQLCNVHSMVKWAYAYQAARKGPWEEYARDRDRFKRRISEASRVLDAVLQDTHRSLIYNDRFVSYEVPLKI